MRLSNTILLSVLSAILVLSSCSTTRYVPKGSDLLNSIRLETVGEYERDVNKGYLSNYVRQKPNSRWFSLFKLPLATYSLSGRDSSKWVNRMLRSMGEAPVLYNEQLAELTCRDLQQELRNEGFLNAKVSKHVAQTGKKKVGVVYRMELGEPYFIHHINYEIADSVIDQMMATDSVNRLIHEGSKFNVAVLDNERKRITEFLTDKGYYRFHKEYISYAADTAKDSRLINLTLFLDPYTNEKHEDTLHTIYYIRNIRYASGDPNDSKIHLRKHVQSECTYLAEKQPYSSRGLQNTYARFGRLQAVKYTNINFVPIAGTDSLDCDIHIQTNKPSTISFQPEGTNTAGDLGAAASLTYQNQNLFRGSEVLSVELRGAYEAIRGLEGYSTQDFIEYSAQTRLQFPRFIFPFVSHKMRQHMNATSEVSLMYDLQDRPEFHRRVVSAAWRYKWNFPHRHDRFQLDLIDLNYVFMPWISDTFKKDYLDSENNRNAILRYNYADLFITKLGLGYSYSKGNFAIKTNVESSGSLLSLASKMFNANKDADNHYRVFNIAFAQYAKFDIDLTRSLQIDNTNQLVFHCGFGIAYPYGNSTVLPFEKRYFSGGANSVRGWSVRSLGPGKYKEKDGRINFINQTGDMKLDLNMEYRTKLFWKLGGALFVDAGNIWTLREYDEQPGGQFKLDTFVDQIAVGYGLGLRLNFDYFIIRFDLGMKAINPAFETEDEEHFPFLHPRFSRDYAFHFAVGLPF